MFGEMRASLPLLDLLALVISHDSHLLTVFLKVLSSTSSMLEGWSCVSFSQS